MTLKGFTTHGGKRYVLGEIAPSGKKVTQIVERTDGTVEVRAGQATLAEIGRRSIATSLHVREPRIPR